MDLTSLALMQGACSEYDVGSTTSALAHYHYSVPQEHLPLDDH